MPTRAELAKERRLVKERFAKARIAERQYARHLVAVGRHVGAIVKGFADKGIVDDFDALRSAMTSYSRLLTPWAKAVSSRMISEVSIRDYRAWSALSKSIGSALHQEITKAPTGQIQREMLNEQVRLITSLPTEAAERVHKLTMEALISGRRANEIAKEIERSGHVTVSRAKLIARTEVARTASTLTQARAEWIGSTHYEWMTSRDGDVRPEHKVLQATIHAWDDPPVAGPNDMRYHAGQGPNCRCYCAPILPDRVR